MKKIALLDLEWTSWYGNYYGKNLINEKRLSWQKKEIIQIGLIIIDENYKLKKKISVLVKPVINPKLSQYIINLTGITQKKIDLKGISFISAYKALKKNVNNCIIVSNGTDGDVLSQNLKFNKLNEKNLDVINIKNYLHEIYNIPDKFLHSTVIHTYFGYKLFNTNAHNALNDCLNIHKALKKIKFDFNILNK